MVRLSRDPARRVFIFIVSSAMLSIALVLAAVILVVVARYSFVTVSLDLSMQMARELIVPRRTSTFDLACVILTIIFDVFRFPVLMEFSITMPIFVAEFSVSRIVFLILVKIDSARVVSVLIDSVNPFNPLLITLSTVFVICCQNWFG